MPQPTYGIQNKTVPTTSKSWGRFSEARGPIEFPAPATSQSRVPQGRRGIWIAYFLLAMTTACLLTGFVWYFGWAHERKATSWYLAGVASLIGATCVALDRLFAFGFQGWDVALSFSILYFAAAYGIWRLVRSIVVRSFSVLLLAVSEVGSAWRGESPR